METKKREFIDPNDLMQYINENHCYSGLPMAAHICTMELLTYAPRVDAVEVVHGRWTHDNPWLYGFECNQCGKWILPEDGTADMNYCPNCGAKMDGDK